MPRRHVNHPPNVLVQRWMAAGKPGGRPWTPPEGPGRFCECPGCNTQLAERQMWFCETCQYDVGAGCGCGFIPEWNR